MTKFEKIMEIVKGFQQKADKIFAEYTEKERIARGKFSEAGFRTEFMLDAYPRYASQVQSEAYSTYAKSKNKAEVFGNIISAFFMLSAIFFMCK